MTSTRFVGMILDDRFRIIQFLGEGGMGAVYLAEQLDLHRLVAIKILTFRHAERTDDATTARFLREAKSLSRLQHPRIVTFLHFGVSREGLHYIAMEYVKGESLESRLCKAEALGWRQALTLVLQVCDAMSHMHKVGVIHRDLKPENIILTGPNLDEIKVLDFGLSILQSERIGGVKTTLTGQLIGTAPYMSPEQCLGAKVDHRADIYSLGCILYKCLTGKLPFDADNAVGVMYKHVHEEPVEVRLVADVHSDLPEAIDKILQKALAKKTSDRYQDIDEMAKHLQLLLNGKEAELPDFEFQLRAKNGVDKSQTMLYLVLIVSLVLVSTLCAYAWQRRAQPNYLDAAKRHAATETLAHKQWSYIEPITQKYELNHDYGRAAKLIEEWLFAHQGTLSIDQQNKAYEALSGVLGDDRNYKAQIAILSKGIDSLLSLKVSDDRLLHYYKTRLEAEVSIDDHKKASMDVKAIEALLKTHEFAWKQKSDALCTIIKYLESEHRFEEQVNLLREVQAVCAEQVGEDDAQRELVKLNLQEVGVEKQLKHPAAETAATIRFRRSYDEYTNDKSAYPSELATLDLLLADSAAAYSLHDLSLLCTNHGLSLNDQVPTPLRAILCKRRADDCLQAWMQASVLGSIEKTEVTFDHAGIGVSKRIERDLVEATTLFALAFKHQAYDSKLKTSFDVGSFYRQSLVELAGLHIIMKHSTESELEEAINLHLGSESDEKAADLVAQELTSYAHLWSRHKFYNQSILLLRKSLEIYEAFPALYKVEKDKTKEAIAKCNRMKSANVYN